MFFKEERSDLILIDLNNTLIRSLAVNRMLSHKGICTGGIYGFMMQLSAIINGYNPRNIVVCDDKRPYLREEEFKEFKADREKTDDEDGFFEALQYNKGKVKKILELMNIPVLAKKGLEADDWIALLTAEYSEEFDRVIAVVNDTDLYSLFKFKNVYFHKRDQKLKKTFLYGRKEFDEEHFPVTPENWVLYTAMVGSHNNFPGLKGIGKKTAQKILSDPSRWEDTYRTNKAHFEKADKILSYPFPGVKLDLSRSDILLKHQSKTMDIIKLLVSHGIEVRSSMETALDYFRD